MLITYIDIDRLLILVFMHTKAPKYSKMKSKHTCCEMFDRRAMQCVNRTKE